MTDLFQSFFLGGFECATHRRKHDGARLDVISASQHDVHAAADYARCAAAGILTVREGTRWHRIESRPGSYDFSSELPRIRAARDAGVQVIWDLFHYGWPDDIDIFRPDFVDRFGRFSRAFAELIADETDQVPLYAPVNEISFTAWAGGSAGFINPFRRRRAPELKRQLVRAAIQATESVWSVDQRARIFHVDPVINIVADPARPQDRTAARRYTRSQYDAWDMIAGRQHPEIGGDPKYLDVIGVNLYDRNQWIHNGMHLRPGHALYRPFRDILRDVYERYDRPLFVAETGTEGEARPLWLRYMGREARAALRSGIPLQGLCLYPILNHPGWDDDRHCHCGLWGYADDVGAREIFAPLERELIRQQRLLRLEQQSVQVIESSNTDATAQATGDPRANTPSEQAA
ncbi:MAG: beta-glucosidase [Gemmatimonadaceae bacterium]